MATEYTKAPFKTTRNMADIDVLVLSGNDFFADALSTETGKKKETINVEDFHSINELIVRDETNLKRQSEILEKKGDNTVAKARELYKMASQQYFKAIQALVEYMNRNPEESQTSYLLNIRAAKLYSKFAGAIRANAIWTDMYDEKYLTTTNVTINLEESTNFFIKAAKIAEINQKQGIDSLVEAWKNIAKETRNMFEETKDFKKTFDSMMAKFKKMEQEDFQNIGYWKQVRRQVETMYANRVDSQLHKTKPFTTLDAISKEFAGILEHGAFVLKHRWSDASASALYMAGVNMSVLGKQDEAKELFLKSVSINAHSQDSRAFLRFAEIASLQKNFKAMKEALEGYTAHTGREAEAHIIKAKYYEDNGNLRDSRLELEEAEKKRKKSPETEIMVTDDEIKKRKNLLFHKEEQEKQSFDIYKPNSKIKKVASDSTNDIDMTKKIGL